MRPFASSPIWPLIDWLGDRTAIPESWSIHLLSVQWGWGSASRPDLSNLRIWTRDTPSLFMNGLFFIQLRLPFWIGVQIRWAATGRAYLQTGLGWKGNGRLAVLLRMQSDESAAVGMDGPNYGQAVGFMDGTK